MEETKALNKQRHVVLKQSFDGKEYKLYKGEKYFSRGRKRMHTEVWKKSNGDIPKGYHIHHIDGNTHNNDISNLNLVSANLHLKFEGKKRVKENQEWFKEFHSKGIEKAKEWHKSEEGKKWHSEHGKRMWVNRPYHKKECEECGKEYETRHNGVSKYCHQNCKAKANRRKRIARAKGL
jgi:hypothetical protein